MQPGNPLVDLAIFQYLTKGFPGIINIVGLVCEIPGKPEVTKAGDSRLLDGFPGPLADERAVSFQLSDYV